MAFNIVEEFGQIDTAYDDRVAVVQQVEVTFDKGRNAGRKVNRIEVRIARVMPSGDLYTLSGRDSVLVFEDVAEVKKLVAALNKAANTGQAGTVAEVKATPTRRRATKKVAAKVTTKPRARRTA